MKTIKILTALLMLLCLPLLNVNAQTKQFNMRAVCTHAWLACTDVTTHISGEWTYHVTYHLGKTGKIEWIHWNVLNYDLTDDDTGEKYMIIDTATDKLNYFDSWNFWNSTNAFNEGFGVEYDVPDGSLTDLLPENNPEEGKAVASVFRIKSRSGMLLGLGRTIFQLHINANGDLTGSVDKSYFECF